MPSEVENKPQEVKCRDTEMRDCSDKPAFKKKDEEAKAFL